jgi:hypothetical protein
MESRPALGVEAVCRGIVIQQQPNTIVVVFEDSTMQRCMAIMGL